MGSSRSAIIGSAAAAGLVLASLAQSASAAAPLLVSATYLGTSGHDAIECVAVADDGSIYVAGNTASPAGRQFGGVRVAELGKAVEASNYGCGFVAKLKADGTRLLAYAQFAKGSAHLTSVAVHKDGRVYVGGYATEGLARLVKGAGGLLADRPRPMPAKPAKGKIPAVPLSHLSGYHGDFGGTPVVLCFDAALSGITAATWLEGHHYVWHVPKPLDEYRWTPTDIALVPDGDIAVLHDGGVPGSYYFACDYVSRLSKDLKKRAWRAAIHHPTVDPPSKVPKYWPKRFPKWSHPAFGQTRGLRLRSDARGNLYIPGWSVSRTSREPWWCPFLFKLSPAGKGVWKAWSFDPMSGRGDRMGGLVSDAAVRSVAVDDDGNVLAAGVGDGGNSVLRRDPRDYTQPAPKLRGSVWGFRGRTLFWGHVARLAAGDAELLGGNHLAAYAEGRYQATWAVDLTALSDGRVLAVGRHTRGFRTSPDAWFKDDRRGGFLKLYSPDFGERFTTSIPDADPFAVARRGNRCVVVGSARSEKTPVKNAVFSQHAGNLDGYLLVVDCPR